MRECTRGPEVSTAIGKIQNQRNVGVWENPIPIDIEPDDLFCYLCGSFCANSGGLCIFPSRVNEPSEYIFSAGILAKYIVLYLDLVESTLSST